MDIGLLALIPAVGADVIAILELSLFTVKEGVGVVNVAPIGSLNVEQRHQLAVDQHRRAEHGVVGYTRDEVTLIVIDWIEGLPRIVIT